RVGTGNRKVGLKLDPVAGGRDELDAGGRRVAVLVGELDEALRYCRHVDIVAGAAPEIAHARRGGGARGGVGGPDHCVRLCRHERGAEYGQPRRGGRRRRNCGRPLSVWLARTGTVAVKPANRRSSNTAECPWTPSTR